MARIHVWISHYGTRVRGARDERNWWKGSIRNFDAPRGVMASVHFPDGKVIKEWTRYVGVSLGPKDPGAVRAPLIIVESVSLLTLRRPLPFRQALEKMFSRAEEFKGVKDNAFDSDVEKMRGLTPRPDTSERYGVEVLIDPIHSVGLVLRNLRGNRWFLLTRFSRTTPFYRSQFFSNGQNLPGKQE